MKSTLSRVLIIFFVSFLFLQAKAQDEKHCGVLDYQKELYQNHPELISPINVLEDKLNNLDVSKLQKNKRGNYIIPVVVHVLHNYGIENISDAQIQDAIRVLNENYQKRNPDTSLIVPVFKPIIANVGFEFRLATLDPNGNCTNGIDRINTYKTYFANDQSKINAWPQNHYLNIWTARSLSMVGMAGVTTTPSQAHLLPYYDGVLMLHEYFGGIGTGNPYANFLSTHELGHYFNLQHTWGNINNPGLHCGDDFVLDTPPTEGHYTCLDLLTDTICKGTNDNTPTFGPLENIQNNMEFSFCLNSMFTNGQKDRMHNCINDTIGHRSDLFKTSNLIATGTLDSNAIANCTPIADFNATKRFVCLGSSTKIINYSYNNTISSTDWTLPNATPSTSTNDTVTVSYSTIGWQSVSLKATNASNVSNTKTISEYIYVSDPKDKNPINEISMFETPSDYARWPIFNYFNNQFKWKYYDGGNTPTGWRALMFDGFDNRSDSEKITLTPYQDIDDIITPAYNTKSLANGYLSFKYAGATTAGNISQIDHSLKIYYSRNCGTNWTQLDAVLGTTLANNGSTSFAFYPTQNSNWSTYSIALPYPAKDSNTYFKISHIAGTYSNNLFIDNFMVGDYPTVTNDINENNELFTLVPNPTSTKIVIKCRMSDVSKELYNSVGQLILSTKENEIDVSRFPKGLYYIKCEGVSKKVIVE